MPVEPIRAITAGASRVASDLLCLHAVAITPAGPREPVRSYCPLDFDLPRPIGGSVPALNCFEACSAFTHVTAYRLAESPTATLSIGGFSGFVTSTAAPIATGWSEPVPGRDFHPLKTSAFHGAQLAPFYPDADRSQAKLADLVEEIRKVRNEMESFCREEKPDWKET